MPCYFFVTLERILLTFRLPTIDEKNEQNRVFFTVKFLMLLFKQNTCQKGVHFYWKICMHSNGRKEATELLELYLQRFLIFRFYTRANIILFRWAIFEDWHEFCWTLKFKITAINKFPFNFCLKCGCQSKRIIYLGVWDLHQGTKIDYK